MLLGFVPADPLPAPNDPVPPPPIGPNVPPGTTWAQYLPKQLSANTGIADVNKAMDLLDKAKVDLMGQVTYLGAISNRLEATLDTVSAFEVDITSSLSEIRDVDMAAEMTHLTKSQVLAQSAQAMLAQANQRPLQVLELLRNN
jgi:flagellin